MKTPLDFRNIDIATQRAMLDFINRAPHAAYLTGAFWLRDDPDSGYEKKRHGDTIGITVAKRILDLRNSKPNQVLTDITELNEIAYFGQDKLHDFAFTLQNLDLHRNRVNFVFDGADCRQLLLDVIKRATNYLHLSSFLFFNDEAGQAVVNELIATANRGVQVRVMLDANSTKGTDEGHALNTSPGRMDIDGLIQNLSNAGVRVRDMQPLKKPLSNRQINELLRQGVPQSFIDEQVEVNNNIVANFNHVDHRKMVIADGKECIIMSHGIGSEYIYSNTSGPRTGSNTRKPRWHDAATHIVGGASKTLNRFFVSRWTMAGGPIGATIDLIDLNDPIMSPPSVAAGSDTVTFLGSIPGQAPDSLMDFLAQEVFGQVPDNISENPIRDFYANDLLSLAQKEIFIQNPYVIDGAMMLEWVRLLKLRNDIGMPVSFNLIRPSIDVNDYKGSNIPLIKGWVEWLFTKHDDDLRSAGANIFEYTRGFDHLKLATVDDWMAVHGSYNLNYRSAKRDFEIVAVVHSKTYTSQIKQMLTNDVANDSRPAGAGPTLDEIILAFLDIGLFGTIDFLANEFG